ncbi:MAG: hypothetical protein AB7R89_05945 [Dehalococcoidia bacterium]
MIVITLALVFSVGFVAGQCAAPEPIDQSVYLSKHVVCNFA